MITPSGSCSGSFTNALEVCAALTVVCSSHAVDRLVDMLMKTRRESRRPRGMFDDCVDAAHRPGGLARADRMALDVAAG
jgi:hypothetical protein